MDLPNYVSFFPSIKKMKNINASCRLVLYFLLSQPKVNNEFIYSDVYISKNIGINYLRVNRAIKRLIQLDLIEMKRKGSYRSIKVKNNLKKTNLPNVTKSFKIVLCFLLCNSEFNKFVGNNEEIAERTGLKIKRVNRAISNLKKYDYIETRRISITTFGIKEKIPEIHENLNLVDTLDNLNINQKKVLRFLINDTNINNYSESISKIIHFTKLSKSQVYKALDFLKSIEYIEFDRRRTISIEKALLNIPRLKEEFYLFNKRRLSMEE